MEDKTYPEVIYYGRRETEGGAQPVYKQIPPDGIPVILLPDASQKLLNHSPDGFQWGYGGSGPAQLALALLLDATSNPKTAQDYYQEFKFDKVSGWGREWAVSYTHLTLPTILLV